jgi:hypothetical protein
MVLVPARAGDRDGAASFDTDADTFCRLEGSRDPAGTPEDR